MDDDRIKWDRRYAEAELSLGAQPSVFLAESIGWIDHLCPGFRALDIACGEGRNSICLARNGYAVTGIDISGVGLAKAARRAEAEGVAVEFIQADLESYDLRGGWDLIININFLLRDLFPKAVSALNPGGVMLVDTLLDSPSQSAIHTRMFLLRPGELRQLFGQLPGTILHYDECPGGNAPTARLIFRKNGPALTQSQHRR